MKLFRLFLLCFALIFPIKNFAGGISSYDHVVFFGDSLTDNGNLYNHDFGVLPKSPPYSGGRFSNGRVWSEYFADYFHDPINNNYAVGGETTYLHIGAYLPYSMKASILQYLWDTQYQDRSRSLFIVWIGANDYLGGSDDIDGATAHVVHDIQADIEDLIENHGARNFLVFNLPDLSKTPYSAVNNLSSQLSQLSIAHNLKLANAVLDIQAAHGDVNIRMFDVYSFMNTVLSDIDATNQKYHTHLTNMSSPCWSGAYTVKQKEIEKQLKAKSTLLKAKTPDGKDVDPKALAGYIANTPSLAVAYSVGEGDSMRCANPDNYFFWDKVHPSAVAHQILAQAVIDYMNAG